MKPELDRYRLVLRQLDLCQAELHGLGFITDADQSRIEKFVDAEKVRVDRAVLGIPAGTAIPSSSGLPSLDAARKVAARLRRESGE